MAFELRLLEFKFFGFKITFEAFADSLACHGDAPSADMPDDSDSDTSGGSGDDDDVKDDQGHPPDGGSRQKRKSVNNNDEGPPIKRGKSGTLSYSKN